MESDAFLRKQNAWIQWADDSMEYNTKQKRVRNESNVTSSVKFSGTVLNPCKEPLDSSFYRVIKNASC